MDPPPAFRKNPQPRHRCRVGHQQQADQLKYHLQKAAGNGASGEELIETITHLAFYAGWLQAISAMNIANEVLRNS